MDSVLLFLRGALKILLLLIGLTLLVGGGACVVMDISFSLSSSSRDLGLILTFTLIAAVVAVVGWFLVWLALRLLKKPGTQSEN